MYVGHFASAFACAALRPRRGVLAYTALAVTLPDVAMLAASPLGCTLNFHVDAGALLCLAAVVGIGVLARAGIATIALGVGALLSHLPFDLLYVSRDASNLYAHPWIDFPLEAGLVAIAALAFTARAGVTGRRFKWLGLLVLLLVTLQGAWDFGGGFRRF